jgi:ribosomal protein L11 methylase PrmA
MLDVGAGTGILGISASMLNSKFKKIDLIEIDLEARRIARKNIQKNNIKNVKMLDILINESSEAYDLVVSNIISSVLYEIKDELIKKTKNILVLSGVQATEKDEFIEKFSSDKLELLEDYQLNDWIGLLYIKR